MTEGKASASALRLRQKEASPRASALRLLKFRPRSEQELHERLIRKGVAEPEVRKVVEDLRKKGFVDDVRFARLFVSRQMHSKPIGRRMLLSRLKARGIAPEVAQGALEQGAPGPDDLELARQAAGPRMERMRDLPRETADRRLFGFLSRRGFSSEVVYQVIRESHEQR